MSKIKSGAAILLAALALAACGGSDNPLDDAQPGAAAAAPSASAAYYEHRATAGHVSVGFGGGTASRVVLARTHRNVAAPARLFIAASATGVRAVGPLAWPADHAGVTWVLRVNGAQVATGAVHDTALRAPTVDGVDAAVSHEHDLRAGDEAVVELVAYVVSGAAAAAVAWDSLALTVSAR